VEALVSDLLLWFDQTATFLGESDLFKNILPAIIFLGTVLIGLFIEIIVLRRLYKWTLKTKWQGDEVIVSALRRRVLLWSTLIGIYWGLYSAPWLPDRNILNITLQILVAIFILSVTQITARVSAGLLNINSNGEDVRGALSIISNIIRVAIYTIGILLILQTFSLNITPLFAALGVTGLAVSLALQSTLTDFISGLQIIAARQVRPGDYVKLEDGSEGYVADINWRTTRIRELSNNMIVIPNSKITSSIILNYHEPERPLYITLDVRINYGSDLDLVESVTLDVANKVLADIPKALVDRKPSFCYTAFGDLGIGFSLSVPVCEYADQFALKHALIKQLYHRYQEEKIQIPFFNAPPLG
jgi:small-conductance mechanosensitive channel